MSGSAITVRASRRWFLGVTLVFALAVAIAATEATSAGRSGSGQPPPGFGKRMGAAPPDSAPGLQPPPGFGKRMGAAPPDSAPGLQPANPHPDLTGTPTQLPDTEPVTGINGADPKDTGGIDGSDEP